MEIRTLAERDLDEADRIFRLAFGTFVGLPEPGAFGGDSDYVRTRWRAAPDAALGAFEKGVLIGSNFLTRWGAFGFFGPLSVRPDRWGSGAAQALLRATMERFEDWGLSDLGLFTFPQSAKHVGLYQAYGFWPQRLTAIMAKGLEGGGERPAPPSGDWREALPACRALTNAILPGLDLEAEIAALEAQGLGAFVRVEDEGTLSAFAVMHCGPGTEAGSGVGFVKFGAARDAAAFGALLRAVEAAARARGLERVVAGVNTARTGAYRRMLQDGYRTMLQGVAMQKDDRPGFNRPDCYVIDDWR
jgi:GNAT superfamily N-acetyltransferase